MIDECIGTLCVTARWQDGARTGAVVGVKIGELALTAVIDRDAVDAVIRAFLDVRVPTQELLIDVPVQAQIPLSAKCGARRAVVAQQATKTGTRRRSMTCERCNVESEGYDLFPYCEKCGQNFCDRCWTEMRMGEQKARCPSGGDHTEEPSGPGDDSDMARTVQTQEWSPEGECRIED